MLGGGVFVTQNKTLPGSYINVINASNSNSTVGERGTVAIALPLNHKAGEIIIADKSQFLHESETLFGAKYDSTSLVALREIFLHATKVLVYDLGGNKTVADACAAFESYDFNVLCAYTDAVEDIATYIAQVKTWRDEMGKKCQLVVYDQTAPNYEGVINVVSTVSNDSAPEYALLAWVAGAEAGCAINKSCTNMKYDGEYTIVAGRTQYELENCLKAGQFVFHNVYGDMCILEDINSMTAVTEDKGEDFKYNQTIRVIDQVANDIAKMFNTKYLGKIPNNASGRVTLWGDIVKHHKQLEEIQAIENFDSSLVTVEQGNTKKSVVVNDVITVVNAMAQLYMTLRIQ